MTSLSASAMLPKHIFLSYAREDLDRAKRFVSTFERAGWSVWWDQQIMPGEPFRRTISHALTMSRCVVVLWSRHSSESGWVADEADKAKERKALIPVLIDDVDPPLGFRGLESARLVDWHGAPDHPELKLLLDAIARRVGPSSVGSQALADAYFVEQRDLIQQQVQGFVGRAAAGQALDEFVGAHDRGYFLIRGGPGQGKTALACHLVGARGLVHHFASHGTYRADPKLAIRSLLAQLTTEETEALPRDISELTRVLGDRLAEVAREQQRLVILFDALDEVRSLDRDDAFLPVNPVPPGVFIVVTSRPGERLDRLLEQLATVPYALYELGPMDRADLTAIARQQDHEIAETELNRVVEAVAGNPLFLRAVLTDLPAFRRLDDRELPQTIEGYFRRVTREFSGNGHDDLMRSVLALLATARRALTLQELSEITGASQRELHDAVIRRVRPYLSETKRHYGLFHKAFADFITRSLLFEDEVVRTHKQLAAWLTRPDCSAPDYRMNSLAFHLYHAGDHEALANDINATFLARKAREVGWSVLEDMELMSQSYLETGDAKQFQEIVSRVHRIHTTLGPEIVERTERLMRGVRSLVTSRDLVTEPQVSAFRDLDLFVAILPKKGVSADFVELCAIDDRLFVIIGDVPGTGIESAFAARFLANLAAKTLRASLDPDLGKTLGAIRRTVSSHRHFDSITMQLAELDPARGVAAICNAGHVFPVRYSSATGRCDVLPATGHFLNPIFNWESDDREFVRHVELDPGDVMVFLTDGLTGSGLRREPYGYKFERIVQSCAGRDAKSIGEEILTDWGSHYGDAIGDDVALVIVSRRTAAAGHPPVPA